MDNPWINLPHEYPFILPIDKSLIDDLNQKLRGTRNEIRLELLPEPYIGNPSGKLVILNINPGFREEEIDYHRDESFIKTSRDNLLHNNKEFPFHLLDPKNNKSKGYDWWCRRLRELNIECSLVTVAQETFCIEFFPYHSRNYKDMPVIIPSQHYNFYLVRQAVKRNAMIVVMMGKATRWLKHIPELKDYDNFCAGKSWENGHISRKNLPEHFDQIVKLLNSH